MKFAIQKLCLCLLLLLIGLSTDSRAVVSITATESGDDVIIVGEGSLNLSVWGPSRNLLSPNLSPDNGIVIFRNSGSSAGRTYGPHIDGSPLNFSGPLSIGSGSGSQANSTTGDHFGILPNLFGSPVLLVPSGYVSGQMLSASMIFQDESFASLGLDEDIYNWSWGEWH